MLPVSTELSVAAEAKCWQRSPDWMACPNLVNWWVSKNFLLLSVCTDMSLCEMKAGLVE